MAALMRLNPVRATLRAAGTAYGSFKLPEPVEKS
jgi:hypothetical protein